MKLSRWLGKVDPAMIVQKRLPWQADSICFVLTDVARYVDPLGVETCRYGKTNYAKGSSAPKRFGMSSLQAC